MKVTYRNQVPSPAFLQQILCDHISEDHVTMTIWRLHIRIQRWDLSWIFDIASIYSECCSVWRLDLGFRLLL